MTILTTFELAINYPHNILIVSEKAPNGKYAVFCYMLRKGEIHKLMLSSSPVFSSGKKAENYMHRIAKEVRETVFKTKK